MAQNYMDLIVQWYRPPPQLVFMAHTGHRDRKL